ncbi:hypothetical protein [Thermococcus sp.]|uniref:hypothetical protein n=1 Tax=Thermococcus sp. TaxID=35749 RepID=UPI0025D8AE07|nr:hypothetical protein [Thermococcus sp.]
MEKALIEKFFSYLRRGDGYLKEKRLEAAYNSYMDGLYTFGAYLVYLDTGLLLPQRELTGFLKSRHPEVYELILRFSGLSQFKEETVKALGDELRWLGDVVI